MENNKKYDKKILVTILIGIISLIIIILFKTTNSKLISSRFTLDSSSKYIVTTDSQFSTLRDDGGSHINVYYQIDLQDNSITKCQDEYVGFKGYKYKGKIIYSKILNGNDADTLKELLNDMVIKKDEEKDLHTSNYKYYTLSTIDYEEIIINDSSMIEKFESLVKE